jgi:hypothetical protein
VCLAADRPAVATASSTGGGLMNVIARYLWYKADYIIPVAFFALPFAALFLLGAFAPVVLYLFVFAFGASASALVFVALGLIQAVEPVSRLPFDTAVWTRLDEHDHKIRILARAALQLRPKPVDLDRALIEAEAGE